MAANPALTQQASRGRDDPVVTGLVTRARNGDRQAWDALVDRYAPLIWSICRRYRLEAADAEGVCRDQRRAGHPGRQHRADPPPLPGQATPPPGHHRADQRQHQDRHVTCMTAVNGKSHLCRSAFLADPRDPGHRPCHHRPYAQNSLIWIPRVVIVIGYRRRTERRQCARCSDTRADYRARRGPVTHQGARPEFGPGVTSSPRTSRSALMGCRRLPGAALDRRPSGPASCPPRSGTSCCTLSSRSSAATC
jgi:hypothetical protein